MRFLLVVRVEPGRAGPGPRTAGGPGVAAHLRVERRRQQVALPDRDDPTGGRAVGHPGEHLDAGTDLLDPRRPDEHGVHASRPCPRRRCRPRTSRPAGRRRCGGRVTSSPPKVSWPAAPSTIRSASRIIPAQVPNAGMPPAIRLRIGSKQLEGPGQLGHRRRLARPGSTQRVERSSSAGRRTPTGPDAEAPAVRRCSADVALEGEDPDGRGAHGSPAALGEPVRLPGSRRR